MTIERKVTSSSRNATANTKPNTYQMRDPMRALKSSEPAVNPETPTNSPPFTCGSTLGTTSSRSERTAASDVSSVPVPASGTSITATCPSGLASTVIGSLN